MIRAYYFITYIFFSICFFPAMKKGFNKKGINLKKAVFKNEPIAKHFVNNGKLKTNKI